MIDEVAKLISFFCSSTASVIFTSIFLIFYIKYGQIRNNFASQLILILAFADLLCWSQTVITNLYLLSVNDTNDSFNDSVCIYLAYVINLSSMTILIIVFLISFSIYLSTVRNIVITDHKFEIWFGATWIILILSTLPFITGDYGRTDHVLCWIAGKPMKFFSYYMIILVIFVIDFYCIIKTLQVIKKLPILASVKTRLKRHLILFPLIFIFSFSAGLINSIICLINPDLNIYWLEVLDYILEPMDGVLNPLAYMLINEKVYKGVKQFFMGSRISDISLDQQNLISDDERKVSYTTVSN